MQSVNLNLDQWGRKGKGAKDALHFREQGTHERFKESHYNHVLQKLFLTALGPTRLELLT